MLARSPAEGKGGGTGRGCNLNPSLDLRTRSAVFRIFFAAILNGLTNDCLSFSLLNEGDDEASE